MAALRILLIDDDEAVRLTIRNGLMSAGHNVVEAPNGDRGLVAFEAESFDVVILDILMPEKEGIETIREMRRRNGEVPIIAISGGGSSRAFDFLAIAKSLGATTTLAKPFSRDALLAEVGSVLVPCQ